MAQFKEPALLIRRVIRQVHPAILIFLLAVSLHSASAEPIPVRHPLGTSRGFLALKDLDGRTIAYGDFSQIIRGPRVASRLVFHFRDGSIDDDLTVFSQRRFFRLISNHHIQRGPSFPKPVDAFIDAATGTITSRSIGKDGKENVQSQHLDLPPDIANGLVLTLIDNIPFSTAATKLSYIASSTTKSRLIHLAITPSGLEPLWIAGSHRKAMNFTVKPELGGVAGVVAPLIGKQPDDVHVWVLGGPAPVVVAEQGQLYEGGPIWRIEIVSPTWPKQSAQAPAPRDAAGDKK